LPLLTDSEKQRILVEWNKTEKDYPKEKCLHELFEEQAKVTPESIAVVCEGGELTYGELNERSNRLAHYLRRLGVGPEVLVGICVERSVEMVVGLLGILKAGGAYLPIDPDLPRERIEFMMSDAEVRFVLTKESLVKDRGLRMEHGEHQSFMFDPRIRLIRLDRDGPIIAAENDTNLETTVIQNDLAYVIYTSGSTGQPKGVQVTHKSLLNLVYWHDRAFSVTPFDRATQLATAGFDAAVWELWPYLTVGASVYIADDMTRLDAAVLRDWLVAQAITISFVPTALAESLMTLDWPAATALRVLLTGGDALRVYPPDTLPFRVFNNYGPTECTVVSTSAQVWPNAHPLIPPTIGRPIANSKVYILDVYRNPVPTGVVGEIYIGGAGVARGYLNRPELTAETFISHSFDGEPEQRLYKTGDLARYLPDGNIQFMGRADYQVKIRGYRIELGEIETVLCRHAQVQEAVVVVREDAAETASGTDRRLVGYIGVGENGAPGESELKEFLRRSLPDYMVPSAFVFLKNLPLTANGKLDRGALPAPACRAKGENFREPRNPTEIALADIWSQVLERSPIGLDDNFFDLGGHSLLSARLMARIKEELGAELPLRILFEGPTVAQLAPKIQSKKQESIFRQREQGEYIHLFELQAGDKNKPIFCFPFRGGLDGEFFNFTRIARHFGAQYSFYGLLARGLDGVSEPRRSVAEMAADYLEEIISVQPRGPYIFIGECQGGFVAYEAARQIMADGGEMGLLVLLDTHASVPARGFWRRCAVPLKYRVRKSPAWKYFKRRYDYHIQAMRRQSATAALGYSIAKMTRAVATVPFLINLEQAENPRCPESDEGRARLQLDRLKQTFDLAIRRYVLPYYTGRVSLLFNEQSYGANRMRDWADYIGGGMDVYKLPGGHDVCVPQNIPLVAEILRECLGGLDKKSESRHLAEPAYRRSRTSRL
ncbi:MAG TPA: amino acid adenylation domain-containing protein, partial [Candidatus Binatia bacterium]|nr:amino acid adenylation domain-containing protein [Candidatus Binatia bacterium]